MPAGSTALETRKSHARSRVSNGNALFVSNKLLDGRSQLSRRFRDLVNAITCDLGGVERLSEGQKQLVRRVAMLSVACEALEARSVAGDELDVDTYGQMTDRLGRAMGRLGLKRVPRNITPSPLEQHFSRPVQPKAEA